MRYGRFAAALLWVIAAYPLAAENVELATATGTLHGTLLVPAAATPVPVVLIIAGSGPTDRDGNSALLPGANDSLKMLAEAFAAEGIASLRYDKRGVGASSGAGPSEADLRFETYIDDAVAWAESLLGDERFSRLIIAGHSEGSLIGIAAAQRLEVDRVISIAGVGRPAGAILREQLEGQLTPALMERALEIIASLEAGLLVQDVPVVLYALFRPSVQPYLVSWFRYDPTIEIGRLTVPVLVIQGTTDIQVTTTDAGLLADASRDAVLLVIPGMNHVLKDVPDDPDAQLRSYSDPSLPLNRTLASAVTGFIEPARRRRAVRR